MVVMIVMTTKCCVYAMQLTLEQGDKHWTGGRMNFELLQLHSLALERVDGSNVCELFPVLHFCTKILKETGPGSDLESLEIGTFLCFLSGTLMLMFLYEFLY